MEGKPAPVIVNTKHKQVKVSVSVSMIDQTVSDVPRLLAALPARDALQALQLLPQTDSAIQFVHNVLE